MCEIESNLESIDSAGERIMLDHKWCSNISREIQNKLKSELHELSGMRPIQYTYFRKDSDKNWLVAWHQHRYLQRREGSLR